MTSQESKVGQIRLHWNAHNVHPLFESTRQNNGLYENNVWIHIIAWYKFKLAKLKFFANLKNTEYHTPFCE